MACDCNNGPIVVPPTHIFTSRTTAEWTTLPLTTPIPLANTQRFMVRWRMGPKSANIATRLIAQTGDTLFSWSTGYTGGSNTDDTWVNETIELDTNQFAQIGVQVKNDSDDSDAESAWVEMVITPSSFITLPPP